jgi:hypothetical protein
MEQRREAEFQDVDMTSMSVLLGVVAASFVMLGATIYHVGGDQSAAMSIANNPPAWAERMMRNRSAEPSTVGRGG